MTSDHRQSQLQASLRALEVAAGNVQRELDRDRYTLPLAAECEKREAILQWLLAESQWRLQRAVIGCADHQTVADWLLAESQWMIQQAAIEIADQKDLTIGWQVQARDAKAKAEEFKRRAGIYQYDRDQALGRAESRRLTINELRRELDAANRQLEQFKPQPAGSWWEELLLIRWLYAESQWRLEVAERRLIRAKARSAAANLTAEDYLRRMKSAQADRDHAQVQAKIANISANNLRERQKPEFWAALTWEQPSLGAARFSLFDTLEIAQQAAINDDLVYEMRRPAQ